MAHWDNETQKVYYKSAKDMNNGWLKIDCGCSGGIQWGGEYPRECNECMGNGIIYWHKKSKVFAQYPGGSFLGKGKLTKLQLNGGGY